MKLLLLIALLLDNVEGSHAAALQPKVTTIEKLPAKRLVGSLSRPGGSEWCQGNPTYWLIGHDPDDSPWCQVEGNIWKRSDTTKLDFIDELNALDGDDRIDRHDCVSCDVDGDEITDIVCSVGANIGTKYGYNELYITQADGSLIKVPVHGFQKYPTLRTRVMAKLRGANGSQLIFLATDGNLRKDGQTNLHRMFRVTSASAAYFEEVQEDNGPWLVPSHANSVKVAELNGDGLDDIIMCNMDGPAMIFLQNPDETFSNVALTGYKANNWRNVRVADVTGDGIPDMIVTTGYRKNLSQELKLFIFEGSREAPFFDFEAIPYYTLQLPYVAPNLELLDVNDDGLIDIYIVQVDETTNGTYCGGPHFDFVFWTGSPGPYPKNTSYVPPLDYARDILLVGTGIETSPFDMVMMEHSEPGCGFWAEKFGDNKTMILGQGEFDRVGHNLLLEW